ncbi:hypothetical protein [Micromonospora eburnea]|uniref:Uncharacterized protein n=1 Tax=Micromonospora eburnea TaxID=227316 RepID=A0A1C6UU56_9ACTN|nr:hypothetical protein [Micromonospora eburnea]SCL57540.1 hypothetical protein GA0070604_3643 [Micromonospora eburnea]
MLAIRVYDIETGHVQTLTEVADVASAERWLAQFAAGGIGTNDVVYVVDDAPRVAVPHLREPEAGMAA